jgi:hypothetical protein
LKQGASDAGQPLAAQRLDRKEKQTWVDSRLRRNFGALPLYPQQRNFQTKAFFVCHAVYVFGAIGDNYCRSVSRAQSSRSY